METLAATCLVLATANLTEWWADVARLGVLLVLAAVFAEAADRIETLRRYVAVQGGVYQNATSVWLLAAIVSLPAHLVVFVPAFLGVHTLVRNRNTQAALAYRAIYTAASDVLSCLVAALVFLAVAGTASEITGTSGAAGVIAAIATYWLANNILILSIVWLTARPQRARELFSTPAEEFDEIATMSLGALLGVTLTFAPLLSPLTLVVMVVLRRAALVQRLQEQAAVDSRTGLLNSGAWRLEAEREISRTARTGGEVSLLMVDLDHFKQLNDTHGHQAGDQALKAVADCLTETLRGYDAVGRYGGEEFAALLVDADALTGEAVAERVCARIRDIALPDEVRVTASIGVSTAPASRTDLDTLIGRADRALYAAKHAGRDRVRVDAALDPARRSAIY